MSALLPSTQTWIHPLYFPRPFVLSLQYHQSHQPLVLLTMVHLSTRQQASPSMVLSSSHQILQTMSILFSHRLVLRTRRSTRVLLIVRQAVYTIIILLVAVWWIFQQDRFHLAQVSLNVHPMLPVMRCYHFPTTKQWLSLVLPQMGMLYMDLIYQPTLAWHQVSMFAMVCFMIQSATTLILPLQHTLILLDALGRETIHHLDQIAPQMDHPIIPCHPMPCHF